MIYLLSCSFKSTVTLIFVFAATSTVAMATAHSLLLSQINQVGSLYTTHLIFQVIRMLKKNVLIFCLYSYKVVIKCLHKNNDNEKHFFWKHVECI